MSDYMRSKTGIFGLLVILSLSVCPFSSAFAEQPYDAYGYLEMLAETSGVSTDDFVPTLSGAVAVAAGMSIANTAGINYGMAASESLSHLVEAADYPDWDTLSSTSQNSWGTKENYDAAKFNALMSAFGMGQEVERWKNFDSSGGAKFTFGETAQSTLRKLGEIGTRWAQGLPNTVNDVYETLTNRSFLANYFPPVQKYVDASEVTGWPSRLSTQVNYVLANEWTGKPTNQPNTTYYGIVSTPSYVVYLSNGNVVICNTNTFKYYIGTNSNATPGFNSGSATLNDETFYRSIYSITYVSTTLPVTSMSGNSPSTAELNLLAYTVLFGTKVETGGAPPIEEYPEDIQAEGNVETYYPEQGIVQNIGWPEFLVVRQPVIPETGDLAQVIALLKRISTDIGLLDRTSEDLTELENALDQFTFYANGILKVHDEGIYDSLTDIGSDIHDILLMLTSWPKGDSVDAPDLIGDFNFPQLKTKAGNLTQTISELAPFGGILLLSEMVGVLSQTGNISKPEFRVPFKFYPSHDFEVVIDLSWLDDGKVYINFFCILSLIICLVNVTIRVIELEAAG